MDCEVAREALSARIDGEREPVPAPRVDEHLATCERCRGWYSAAIEQTQQLRRLAGRSQVAAVATPHPPRRRRPSPAAMSGWWRWGLALVGVTQSALAVAQGLGADTGLATPGHHALTAGHLVNESTAWSAALGVVMIVAALRPAAAAGLAGVLSAFTVVLTAYVIADAVSGAVTADRIVSHLPVLLGTLLALLVWRDARTNQPDPRSDVAAATAELQLPEGASRGRRRGHLHPTDGSAA